MKKLSFLLSIIFFIFLTSCKKNKLKRSPIIFTSWRINNRWRPQRLILGSDTQKVNCVYYEAIPRDYIGSSSAYPVIKRYYISKDVQDLINNFIVNHCPCNYSCDSMDYLHGDGNFYFFEGYKGKKKENICRLNFKQNAYVFYIGLRNEIKQSKFYNSQSKEILADLRDLSAIKAFYPPPDVEKRFKNQASPKEWKDYLNRKHKRDNEIKKEIQIVTDSLNQIRKE